VDTEGLALGIGLAFGVAYLRSGLAHYLDFDAACGEGLGKFVGVFKRGDQ
jgi:hypothetical protein